jgi:hypothetical protein
VSVTEPAAAAWLPAVPIFSMLQIEDECFRTALRPLVGPSVPHGSRQTVVQVRGRASRGHFRGSAPTLLPLRLEAHQHPSEHP